MVALIIKMTTFCCFQGNPSSCNQQCSRRRHQSGGKFLKVLSYCSIMNFNLAVQSIKNSNTVISSAETYRCSRYSSQLCNDSFWLFFSHKANRNTMALYYCYPAVFLSILFEVLSHLFNWLYSVWNCNVWPVRLQIEW